MHSSIHGKTGRRVAAWLLGGVLLVSGLAPAQDVANDPGVAEILTRGPLHEAFAGTVSFDPVAGLVVDLEPPALIEELPPGQRPEGGNVAWIPGYWAWDGEQGDFLWVSGIWRNLPPGRQWVPGYWVEVEGRYQWTSGYWEDEETTDIDYLPKPPRSVEAGPNIQAASDDQTWVPGSWVYGDDRYSWRAGSWVTPRANWIWIPAYYRWTPRGYVFVDGYWDYPVINRGVVFAPVRFDRGYRSRPDYYYTPSTVISFTGLFNHLFVRPVYGHYYFGDYYEPRYRDRGYYPSYSYGSGRRGYDPIYSHYNWEHRHEKDWDRTRREYFEYRRDHKEARPPRTWAAQLSRSSSDRSTRDWSVAERFDRVVNEGGKRFRSVDKKERQQYDSQRNGIRSYAKRRQELEVRNDRRRTGEQDRAQTSRVELGRSPVASKKSNRPGTKGGPPPRPQARPERDQSRTVPGSKDQKKSDKASPADGRRDPSRPSGERPQDAKPRDDKGRDDKAREKRVAPRPDDRKGERAETRVPRPDPAREKSVPKAPSRENVKPDDTRRPESPPRKAAREEDRQPRPAAERREPPKPKRPAAVREAAEPKPKRETGPTRKESKPARVQPTPEKKTRQATPKVAPRPQTPRAKPEQSKPARPSKKTQPKKSPQAPPTKPETEKAKEDKRGKKKDAPA